MAVMACGRGIGFAGWREVVVRDAFVAHRRVGDDDVPDGDVAVQHAGAPAGDERAAAARDRLFQQARRQRRADTGMEERQTPAVHVDLVERVTPYLRMSIDDVFGAARFHQSVEHVLEETDDAMFGDVDAADEPARLDDRLAGGIEFQNGIFLTHSSPQFEVLRVFKTLRTSSAYGAL